MTTVSSRSTSFFRVTAIAAALALFGGAGVANATTVIDISPSTGNSFRVGGASNQIETMSWSQTGAYSGVTISALVGSTDGSPETVDAYLTSAIGPGAGAPIATATVTVPNFATAFAFTPQTLFSGLSLGAGSYYLTLFNPDTTGNVNIRWARGAAVTLDSGVTANGEFFTNVTNGVPNVADPWRSTFVTSNLYDNAFTVTGTLVAPVPEPATWAMLLLGFTGMGVMASRRKLRHAFHRV